MREQSFFVEADLLAAFLAPDLWFLAYPL